MAEPTRDLLVVGDADVDIFIRADDLPRRGEKSSGALLGFRPGGMGANVACASARLGRRTALLTSIGDDLPGREALTYYQEIGLDTSLVDVVAGAQTYAGLSMLNGVGEKALLVARTASMFPRAEAVSGLDLSSTAQVHLVPFDEALALDVIERGRRAGCLISVDIETSMLDLIHDPRRLLLAVDLVFLNDQTAHSLDSAAPGTLDELRGDGRHIVVITRGAAGASATRGGQHVEVGALPAVVVDTTGGGDCFAAGFLAGLGPDRDLERAAAIGSATAAFGVETLGGSQGVPPIRQVRQRAGRPASED